VAVVAAIADAVPFKSPTFQYVQKLIKLNPFKTYFPLGSCVAVVAATADAAPYEVSSI
jgi:hypothetical protein